MRKTKLAIPSAFYFLFFCFLLFSPVGQSVWANDQTSTTHLHSGAKTNQSSVSNGINGIDVSHHQGAVAWDAVSSAGIKFVYLKATDGITGVDPRYKQNADSLEKSTLLFGAYHFFEPKDDGAAQAAHFLKYATGKKMLPPVLDIEIDDGIASDKIVHEAKQWLKKVESEIGCKPIIYTNKNFWEKYLSKGFSDYALWLADYEKQLTLPKGTSEWLIWQHSQTGVVDGVNGNVDLDVFNGNEDELNSLLCS